MAKSVKQEWAITTWAAKSGSGIVWNPVGEAISGVIIDAYGRQYRADSYVDSTVPRRPYKMEADDSTGITYLMYDTDTNGAVPVIRITEEGE